MAAPVEDGGEGTVYGSSLLSFARLSNAERYCLLFCTLRLYETISLRKVGICTWQNYHIWVSHHNFS